MAIEHHDNDELEYDRHSDEIKAYTNEIMLTMRDMLKLNPLYKDNLLMMWNNDIPLDVGRLCDFMCGMSSADGADLQAILEELDIKERASSGGGGQGRRAKGAAPQRSNTLAEFPPCVEVPD